MSVIKAAYELKKRVQTRTGVVKGSASGFVVLQVTS